MITRSFDFSEQSGSYGNESWVGGLISFDDLYKQIDQNSLRKAHNIKVRLEPQEDTDKWLLTLFVNGTEIDLESNILVQPIHQGEYVTVGYRTWAVNGQNTFSNLMVTPLEASNEEATPRDLLQYLADELYTSGSTVYEYFETRTKKGKTLDSTG